MMLGYKWVHGFWTLEYDDSSPNWSGTPTTRPLPTTLVTPDPPIMCKGIGRYEMGGQSIISSSLSGLLCTWVWVLWRAWQQKDAIFNCDEHSHCTVRWRGLHPGEVLGETCQASNVLLGLATKPPISSSPLLLFMMLLVLALTPWMADDRFISLKANTLCFLGSELMEGSTIEPACTYDRDPRS